MRSVVRVLVLAGTCSAALLLLATAGAAAPTAPSVAPAARTTASGGNGRSSWYPQQGLGASLTGVQQAFSTAVDGQV